MADILHRLELLQVLARTQLKIRYKNAALGYLWSLAHPLAFAGVFYFVFQVVMKSNRPDMAAFLVTGLFPWQWVSNSTVQGTSIFISNASLVKKVAFPRYMLPLSMVLQDGWHFLLALPVQLLIVLASGHAPSLAWIPGLPLLLLLQGGVLFGIALIVGSINMFLRDIEHLVHILMMMLFYGTPIVYDLAQVPGTYRPILQLNPFTPLISCWRSLLLEGRLDWSEIGVLALAAAVLIAVGGAIYNKLSPRFAELV